MRIYVALLLAMFVPAVFGASPSFQSFNTTQFDVTGNQVSIEAGASLTNIAGTIRVAYVATTGSDSASGAKAAPFLTVTNAIRFLQGVGSIIIRGGTYFNQGNDLTNCIDLTIKNYPNEVPKFFYGINIPSTSFGALSNGIFTNAMSVAFSNNLVFLTNYWSAIDRGIFLIQTNMPYGTQQLTAFFQPKVTSQESFTNRCEHTPLFWAASVPAMVASNNLWFAIGNTLYVKFAVSNVVGGLYIPSTNTQDSFVFGGDERTDIKIRGIRSYFGWHGFDLGSVSSAELTSCAGIGNSYSGIDGGLDSQSSLRIYHCEGSLNNLAGLNVGSANIHTPGGLCDVIEIGNYWHDNNEESSSMRGNTVRTAIGTVNYGGIQKWGNIDDGSASRFIGCDSVSNTASQFQLGNSAQFTRSYQKIISSYATSAGSGLGMALNDIGDFLWVQDTYLDNAPINVQANPTTHYVRSSGAKWSTLTGQNDDVIEGGGSTAANYVRDAHLYGTYSVIGAAVYNVPAFATLTGFGNNIFRGAPGANVTPFGLTYDGSIYTSKSNLLVSAAITVGASPFSFTNTAALAQGVNISVYGSSQTTGDCTRNGGVLYPALVGAPWKVELKPGEYITLTYVGSPVMRWVPQ